MSGLLIRHTRVAIPQGLCYGRTDVPLAESFEREAATVRASLPWTPLAVWSSPAERCRRLAARLAAGEVRIEPRLAELDMGEWDGRKWDELSGPVHEAWKADPWGTRPPGGESAAPGPPEKQPENKERQQPRPTTAAAPALLCAPR